MTTACVDLSGGLFNFIKTANGLKNDAALSRHLHIRPANISKIRHGRLGVSALLILWIHENLNMAVAEIRRLIALPA